MVYATPAGVEVPPLGFDTWSMIGRACREAVASTLELGHRRQL